MLGSLKVVQQSVAGVHVSPKMLQSGRDPAAPPLTIGVVKLGGWSRE